MTKRKNIHSMGDVNPDIAGTPHVVRDTPEPSNDSLALDPLTKRPRQKRFVTVIRAERWWAEQARIYPFFFHEYITGKPPAHHHKIWYASIFRKDIKRVNLIAPRESAKTTVLELAYAWLIGKAPLLTNGLISVSATQAEKRLSSVRSIVGDNERYRNVFPYIEIDKKRPDTQTNFTVWSRQDNMDYRTWRSIVSRYGNPRDSTMFAYGQGGKGVVGSRISGIFGFDDIIDETMLKPELQEKVLQYMMQTCIPCIQPGGKAVNIGTRWMIGDVPQHLIENPAWHSIVIPAIKFDEDGRRYSYWPGYWPLQRLDEKKEEMQNNILFDIMYMNDPQATSANLFSLADLSRGIPEPLPPLKSLYITTDSAVSEKTRADWNCYIAVGIDADDNYYLLDMLRFKAHPDDVVEMMVQFVEKIAFVYRRLDAVIIENAGFQAFFKGILERRRTDFPIQMAVPKGDKGHRASLTSAVAKAGKLYINQQLIDLPTLQSEWMNFPKHPHDDTLDPIGLLIQYLMQEITVTDVTTVRSRYLL